MSGSPATQWRRGSCIPPTPTRDSRCPTRHLHDGPPNPSSDHDYTALRSQVLWGAHEPTIVSLSSRNLAPSFAPE